MSSPAPPQGSVPPQDLTAEEHVLGSCLLTQNAIVTCSETVKPEDFYRDSHARIYRAILDLDLADEPVDPITLSDYLQQRGELEQIGGKPRIHELARLVPATANVGHYARIVSETATLRGLIRAGGEIAQLGWDHEGEPAELLSKAEQLVLELAQRRVEGDLEPLSESLLRTHQLLQDHAGRDVTGTPTGLRDLDELTSGLQPGNLVVVAGRPSMGKSALALGIANHVATQETPVALFTLEMSKVEVNQRLLSLETGVPLQRIRRAKLDSRQWSSIHSGFSRLNDRPLFLDDSGDIRLTEMRSRARRLRARQPQLGLVVVDYLQLMTSTAQKRVEQISEISRGLKVLARDLDVPILALSQLSRNLEYRNDKRPILSDLRESGSIEQDADVVLFVYRDSVYRRDTSLEDEARAELIVAKHRNGPIDTVHVHWEKAKARFSDG